MVQQLKSGESWGRLSDCWQLQDWLAVLLVEFMFPPTAKQINANYLIN